MILKLNLTEIITNNLSIHDINISVENLNVPDLLPIEDNKESEESKEDINFEVVHRRNTDDPIDTRRSALANDNSQETPITCHLEQQNIPQQPRAEVSIAEIEVDIGSEESSNIN